MKKFALIGNPISHSESPRLFREAFPDSDMSYDLVERQTIEESVTFLKENGYCGANVTAPFKESAMHFVSNPDLVSKTLNATNLILFKDGKIFSYNTDYLAVRKMIQELCATNIEPSANSNKKEYFKSGSPDSKTSAIVIGCGGAGKAAALACIHQGLDTIITNRTLSKAEDFAKAISGQPGKIKAISIANAESLLKTASCLTSERTILIYTIPKTNRLFCNTFCKIVKESQASTCSLMVIEANYKNPCLNPQSGRTWLRYQAIESFRLFASV